MSSQLLWQPSAERIATANMTAFARAAASRHNRLFPDYAALHRWSVDHPGEFWTLLWDFAGVIGERGSVALVDRDRMPGARWFPEARLNYARNLLCRKAPTDASDALVFWGEDRVKRRLSHAELYRGVAQLAAAMRAAGIVAGDRVAAYMPNLPETMIVMLAAASLGATFSSTSPDFGVQGVLDRFGQIEPRLLFVADGYTYNGKTVDCLGRVAEIAAQLPSLQRVVVVPYVAAEAGAGKIPGGTTLRDFVAPYAGQTQIEFAELPFDHPLFILYSSGTTGAPQCIVHGAGGTLLQHLKEQRLHGDVKAGDRLFYFTTCGWMMWNWLASGLASDATLLLYDGSPLLNTGGILFDYADAEGATHFGTTAKFIDALAKAMVRPRKTHRLAKLRVLFSTGSPLAPDGFDYVYACIKADIQLASICGGADIVSSLICGNPLAPVWRGEIQCAGLGMAADVFDEAGRSLREAKGELVCTRPFPAMPVGFWNDADGARYRAAYFERFPGVWHHGDFAERTDHDGFVIHGRSDATLKPGGVRIGTAEIYRQVEPLDEVEEALVIGQDWPPGRPTDMRVVLFVKLRDGLVLDEALTARIKQAIRDHTTPRHVPAKILQVTDIPRTKSGRIVELAVRDVVHGEPVKNVETLANPEALEQFRKRPELAG